MCVNQTHNLFLLMCIPIPLVRNLNDYKTVIWSHLINAVIQLKSYSSSCCTKKSQTNHSLILATTHNMNKAEWQKLYCQGVYWHSKPVITERVWGDKGLLPEQQEFLVMSVQAHMLQCFKRSDTTDWEHLFHHSWPGFNCGLRVQWDWKQKQR